MRQRQLIFYSNAFFGDYVTFEHCPEFYVTFAKFVPKRTSTFLKRSNFNSSHPNLHLGETYRWHPNEGITHCLIKPISETPKKSTIQIKTFLVLLSGFCKFVNLYLYYYNYRHYWVINILFVCEVSSCVSRIAHVLTSFLFLSLHMHWMSFLITSLIKFGKQMI